MSNNNMDGPESSGNTNVRLPEIGQAARELFPTAAEDVGVRNPVDMRKFPPSLRKIQERIENTKKVEPFKPETASWNRLYQEAYTEKDPEKREALMEFVNERMERAERRGLLDKGVLKSEILSTLRNSSWETTSENYFYTQMANLADNLENRARGWDVSEDNENIRYRNNPKYEGMYRSLVMLVANQVSVQGLRNKLGQNENEWDWDVATPYLAKKIITGSEFDTKEKVHQRYDQRKMSMEPEFRKLMGFADHDLPDLVSAKPIVDEGERDYRRARGEERHVQDEEEVEKLTKLNEQLIEELRKKGALSEREAPSPYVTGASQLPDEMPAVFETGRYRLLARDALISSGEIKDLVPVLDITDKDDRERWIFENIRAFSDGTVKAPESRWHQILDFWLTDLKTSGERYIQSKINKSDTRDEQIRKRKEAIKEIKGIEKTQEDMKAYMAISSTARAMESCSGVTSVYLNYLIPGEKEPNTDMVDLWGDELLTGKPEMYKKVLKNELVRHYYDKLLEDAGIDPKNVTETEIEYDEQNLSTTIPSSWGEVDIKKIEGKINEQGVLEGQGRLIRNLNKIKGKRGFDGYIEELLIEEDNEENTEDNPPTYEGKEVSDSMRRAAAKVAADAFLIDKYSRWQAEVFDKSRKKEIATYLEQNPHLDYSKDEDKKEVDTKATKITVRKFALMKPSDKWGGDPFKSFYDPKNVPEFAKQVYKGGNKKILEMVNSALVPTDIIEDKGLVQATALDNIKNQKRYADVWKAFLGNAQAQGLSMWTNDTMYQDLPLIAKSLYEMYGKKKDYFIKKGTDGDNPEHVDGNQVVATMISRIIETKVLATVVESARPGFWDNINVLFDADSRIEPYEHILKFLYGPDLKSKSGFFAKLTSGSFQLDFTNNEEAKKAYVKSWRILISNDQDANGIPINNLLNRLGLGMDIIAILTSNFSKVK